MDNAIAKPSKKEAFLAPLLKANPLFVLVLGTCPALAVTTTLEQAIGLKSHDLETCLGVGAKVRSGFHEPDFETIYCRHNVRGKNRRLG